MAHRYALEVVDRLLRDLMGTPDLPFGGKVVVISGDFRQLLPVVPGATRSQTVAATHPLSYLWRRVRVLRLTTNMRVQRLLTEGRDAQAQEEWASWLKSLGEGSLPGAADGTIQLPPECCLTAARGEGSEQPPTVMDLISAVYGDIANDPSARDPSALMKRAVLTPLNASVDEINDKVMAIWPNDQERTYLSADEPDGSDDGSEVFPVEVLNSFNSGSLPPHRLTLKVGTPIMLLRNMCPAKGLMNGTRLIVVGLSQWLLQARIVSG
eukprot:7766459-Pyramimonas_sp.AAC.1